jgi:hypothetical protein
MAKGQEQVKPPSSISVSTGVKKTLKVPSETKKGGTTIVPTTKRLPILYKDPSNEAANYIANLPEGPRLQSVQQRLYEGGYYDSNDVVMYGRRSPSDYAAMSRAMNDANTRGETWESATNFRISMNSAGLGLGNESATGAKGGSSKPSGSIQITGPVNARTAFDALSRKYTGLKASDADFADAYNKLVQAQTAAPIQYTTQKINGRYYSVQVSDGVDANDFFEQYLFNKINFGSDEIGGAVGEQISTVKQLSRFYDSSLTTSETGNYARGLLEGSMTVNDVKKTLAERAKAKYKALSDRINEDVTVYDLANDYIAQKANVLEVDPDTLGIQDVAVAFSGDKLMNMSEFIALQKKDPRYQYTRQARNDAASFATNLAAVFRTGA